MDAVRAERVARQCVREGHSTPPAVVEEVLAELARTRGLLAARVDMLARVDKVADELAAMGSPVDRVAGMLRDAVKDYDR